MSQAPVEDSDALALWWAENQQTPLPDSLRSLVQRLCLEETERSQLAAGELTPGQLLRLEESKQLARTRQRNIEDALLLVLKQQEWLQRYRAVTEQLELHRQALYAANKQQAADSNLAADLRRFETFEKVQGGFLRMETFSALARNGKEQLSTLLHEGELLQAAEREAGKAMQQKRVARADKMKHFGQMQEAFERAFKMEGTLEVLGTFDQNARQMQEQVDGLCQEAAAALQDTTQQLEEAQQRLADTKTAMQQLQRHATLLEHGELVLQLLKELENMKNDLSLMRHEYTRAQTKQNEENDMLMRVMAEYRNVESEVRTLGDELTMHRSAGAGKTSYALQERAMRLKIQRQRLESARFLWERIQAGFIALDEKRATINSLRLKQAGVVRDTERLEVDVQRKRRMCRDKEYTLNMSKSQNVIQLRSDLREGTSCTVCGATHHPYHSDTMLEQTKLIDGIRAEYEEMLGELQIAEATLAQLKDTHVELVVRLEMEQKALQALEQDHQANVDAWQSFASLDHSFAGCSPTINHEARLTLIDQLIENTIRDSDDAQQELDTYNFHQVRINEISEQRAKKEQRLSELTTRLNEVNTGCQVMAGRAERALQAQGTLQTKYTTLFEKLMTLINLPDWYNEWLATPESVRLRITSMMENWQALCNSLRKEEEQVRLLTAVKEQQQERSNLLNAIAAQLGNTRLQYAEMGDEARRSYESQTNGITAGNYFANHVEALATAIEEEQKQEQAWLERQTLAQHNATTCQQLKAIGEWLDEQTVTERSELDLWIRKYNASHPPVQYSEMQRVFTNETDWNELRTRLRENELRMRLEQEKVNELQSLLLSMKAESWSAPTNDVQETEHRLAAQRETLEHQLEEVMMQIAEMSLRLQKHQDSTTLLRTPLQEETNN